MPISYDDETLVAYLDGELSSEETAALNASLHHDRELKNRIERLRATWELLGELPEDEPSPRLAQSTIEMVALAVSKEKASWTRRLSSNRWAVLSLASLLAFGGGVAFAIVRSSAQRQEFLQRLPLLVYYEDLALIDSEAWLLKLAEIADLVKAASQSGSGRQITHIPDTQAQRQLWLNSLDNATRASLSDRRPALMRLSPARAAELTRIAGRLPQHIGPDSDLDYLQVLSAYASILDQVGTAERTQLNAIDDLSERAKEVSKLVRREMAIAYAEKLSSQDRAALRSWNSDLQDRLWEVFSRLQDPDAKVVNEIYRPPAESLVTNEDLQELQQNLSAEAKELLADLDASLRRDVLGVWLFYLFEPGPAASNAAADLKSRFEQLDNEEKSRLEFLSEHEVRQQLAQ